MDRLTYSFPQAWALMLPAWKAPQIGLPGVIRWKKYLNNGGGAREQNSLQHSHSITVLGSFIAAQLAPFARLDVGLLVTALAIHDIGEGELGYDTLYVDKSVDGDLKKYTAFKRRYEKLDSDGFEFMHKAYLLQYALKIPEYFPLQARIIMSNLSREHALEALAFEGVERWDYCLYALEQYREHKNEKILVQVLRNQVPHLDRLAKDLPGFGKVVWTKSGSAWAANFLKMHHGKWEEQKGEK